MSVVVIEENEEKEPKLVPFANLSKSGKIVNAYNAIILAAKRSK